LKIGVFALRDHTSSIEELIPAEHQRRLSTAADRPLPSRTAIPSDRRNGPRMTKEIGPPPRRAGAARSTSQTRARCTAQAGWLRECDDTL
jgi:hypothetical protein